MRRLRTDIAQLLEIDMRTRESKQRFLSELNRLERPFDEHADPVHVTASAVVSGPRGTVLHRHKRLGVWLQPGGHIDKGEMPWHAAVREVAEETGIAATHPRDQPLLFHVDVHPGAKGHTHLDLRYLLVAGDVDCTPPSGESPYCRWFAWEEAMAIADPGLAGALRLARSQHEALVALVADPIVLRRGNTVRTEGGTAPRSQGASSAHIRRSYVSEAQRRERGCRDGRMPPYL